MHMWWHMLWIFRCIERKQIYFLFYYIIICIALQDVSKSKYKHVTYWYVANIPI